jgi:hypothetical protein
LFPPELPCAALARASASANGTIAFAKVRNILETKEVFGEKD